MSASQSEPVLLEDDWGRPPSEEGPFGGPGPRRWRVALVVGFIAAALIVVVVLASNGLTAGPSTEHATVVSDPAITVTGGPSGAVYLPFAPSNAPAPSGETDSSVTQAVLTGSMNVVSCTPRCGGVVVEVLTTSELSQLTGSNGTPTIWCSDGSSGCAPVLSVTFHVDVTAYAGAGLNLVFLAPAGSVAVISASATLSWVD